MKAPQAHKLPSGSWRVQTRVGGERVSVTRETRKEAERDALAMMAEYEQKGVRPSLNDTTVGGIVDRYIEDMRPLLVPSTILADEAIRENRLQHMMRMRYRDIKDWQALVNEDVGEVSAKTVQNSWGLVKAALRHAGLTVPAVRLPKVETQREVFLDEEQIRIFCDAVRGSKYETGYLLALHSLRRSELCGLRWCDVDLRDPSRASITVTGSKTITEDGKHWVRVENTKTEYSRRTVPIFMPRLYELLKEQEPYHTGDEPVIPFKMSVFLPNVKKVAQRTEGLPDDLTLHDLRRSFCSLCWALGVDTMTTMKLGGWGSINTVMRHYARLSEAQKLREVDKLRAFFGKKSDPADEDGVGNQKET